jgi:hypothetical protein
VDPRTSANSSVTSRCTPLRDKLGLVVKAAEDVGRDVGGELLPRIEPLVAAEALGDRHRQRDGTREDDRPVGDDGAHEREREEERWERDRHERSAPASSGPSVSPLLHATQPTDRGPAHEREDRPGEAAGRPALRAPVCSRLLTDVRVRLHTRETRARWSGRATGGCRTGPGARRADEHDAVPAKRDGINAPLQHLPRGQTRSMVPVGAAVVDEHAACARQAGTLLHADRDRMRAGGTRRDATVPSERSGRNLRDGRRNVRVDALPSLPSRSGSRRDGRLPSLSGAMST